MALDDEIPGQPRGAKLGVAATSEITGHAIRMVGVIVRQHDVGRPATGELARLTREPLRALRLIEPLDREHRVASDNESTIRDSRPVTAERRRDARPHAIGDALEIAERLARDNRA